MSLNVDLVVEDLTKQIAKLAQEKAIYSALATQKENENSELRKQLEDYKKEESPAVE